MNKEKHLENYHPQKNGELVNSIVLDGPAHMACDVMMLEMLKHRSNNSLSIRFYRWDDVWLSIGYNQKHLPSQWIKLFKEGKLKICRRPSGGSAVLHAGGLTYSLAWKSPPRKKQQAYFEASQWLVKCFAELDFPLKFGNTPQNIHSENCFSTSSLADLVDQEGTKRIGSAQLWRQGNLLQHGEILLDPPKHLWTEIFQTNPPKSVPKRISGVDLEKYLINSIKSNWPSIIWESIDLKSTQLKEIQRNSKNYLLNLPNSDL